MNVRELIRKLLDIEVNTYDLAALRANPRAHVNSDEDAKKLRDLFLLIEMTEGEGNLHDEY